MQAFALSGVSVQVQGTLPKASEEAEALVHIVREATTNAVKHAQARRIEVRLFASDEPLAMRITTTGAPPAHNPCSGYPACGRPLSTPAWNSALRRLTLHQPAESGAEPYGAGRKEQP